MPGPTLTRLAALGILRPGLPNSMPGSKHVQREISYVLSREQAESREPAG